MEDKSPKTDPANTENTPIKLTTLSNDTDYENPVGHSGFAGDEPGQQTTGLSHEPYNSGYDEYLDVGNEI